MNFSILSEAIRLCKRYKSRNLIYLFSKDSEKYLKYINSKKSYNLIIPLLKLYRIYKKRIRVRSNIRKLKVKFDYIKTYLRNLENKKKDLVNSE